MPDDDCSEIKIPPELEAKILELAVETGASYEEVVQAVMRDFFEMVDSDRKDVSSLVERVRTALQTKAKPTSREICHPGEERPGPPECS